MSRQINLDIPGRDGAVQVCLTLDEQAAGLVLQQCGDDIFLLTPDARIVAAFVKMDPRAAVTAA